MTTRIDEELSLLQSVLDVTRSLSLSAVDGDVSLLENLLQEREGLLKSIMRLHEAVKLQLADDQARDQANARVAPVLQAIQGENEKFLEALQGRRKQIVAKILGLRSETPR